MSQMDIIANETASTDQVTYKSIEVDGLNIAYRVSIPQPQAGASAWLPCLLALISESDPGLGGSIPCGRSGLSRLR
jgi:hypothetical protein